MPSLVGSEMCIRDRVKGDISVKELSVEPGASIEGRVLSGSYLSSSISSNEIAE